VKAWKGWSIGSIIPRLVVVMCFIDVALRIVPPAWLGFGPGAAELFFRLPGDAYLRSYHSHSDAVYGDLVSLGNLRQLRLYPRTVTFTTDSLGFRNDEQPRDARAILVGDSFAVAGETNAQTVAGQLSRIAGCRVYNAGSQGWGVQPPTPQEILGLARQLQMKGGLVIFERVERLGSPQIPALEGGWADKWRDGPWFSLGQRVAVFARVSPAKLWAEELFKRLQDDVALPNPYASRVIRKTLRNGDWMLFYTDEVRPHQHRGPISIEYWTWLNRELTRAGFSLLVVLVPDKYTVYYPWVSDPDATVVQPGEFLESTAAALRRAGMQVIDLTQPLRRRAQDDLQRGSYAYSRDDTHWDASGIEVAASEIWTTWRSLSSAPRPACSQR
jgi:hypothetical protein